MDPLAAVVAAQTALIAALDAGDVAGIEAATASLSAALPALRARPVRQGIDHALKQSEAARIRINFLADRNRAKLDRLAEHRGVAVVGTYRRP